MFNDRFEDIAPSSVTYKKDRFTEGSEALAHLYNVALAKNKSWDTPDGAFMSLTAMLENNFEMVNFSNVEVPFTSNRDGYVIYPRDWYLNEDWIENNQDGDIRPRQLIIYAAMTLVHDTKPTVQSIDI